MTTPRAAPSQAPAPERAGGRSRLPSDAAAGLLAAVVLVLLGAPVGLLWAALAPRVELVVRGPGDAVFAERASSAFVDADVAFGALTLLAGLLCGAGAAWLGRRHGPGVVVGLLAGGLLAAFVAARTGERVGLEEFRTAVLQAREPGRAEAAVRLFTRELLVAWPVGALASFAVLFALLRPAPEGAGRAS